jgi:hypothetical protein
MAQGLISIRGSCKYNITLESLFISVPHFLTLEADSQIAVSLEATFYSFCSIMAGKSRIILCALHNEL